MALHFAAGDEYIDHGNASSLNNLDAMTMITVFAPQAAVAAFARMFYKSGNFQAELATDESVVFARARATTATALHGPASMLPTAGEHCILAMIDDDGVTPRMYFAQYPTVIAEVGSYQAQTTGSGLPTDDSASVFAFGARPGGTRHCNWHVSYLWLYNVVLSVGEILQHQFSPRTLLPNCVLKTAYFDTVSLGDLSGNGNNGTLNLTPDTVDHVPLSPPFGLDAALPYEIAVTGRIMSSLAGHGGLAGDGGIAGPGGGLAAASQRAEWLESLRV